MPLSGYRQICHSNGFERINQRCTGVTFPKNRSLKWMCWKLTDSIREDEHPVHLASATSLITSRIDRKQRTTKSSSNFGCYYNVTSKLALSKKGKAAAKMQELIPTCLEIHSKDWKQLELNKGRNSSDVSRLFMGFTDVAVAAQSRLLKR